jgi:hypothetical protein
MSLPNRGRVTLRLQYWHQSPVGESAQHHVLLHEFIRDYLTILAREAKSSYPWNSQLARLEKGTNRPRLFVPVQVYLSPTLQF